MCLDILKHTQETIPFLHVLHVCRYCVHVHHCVFNVEWQLWVPMAYWWRLSWNRSTVVCPYILFIKLLLLFVDNDNRINRILVPCFVHFSILGSSSKGIHDSTELCHVYLSPTCLMYWSVQRQAPNILYICEDNMDTLNYDVTKACYNKINLSNWHLKVTSM